MSTHAPALRCSLAVATVPVTGSVSRLYLNVGRVLCGETVIPIIAVASRTTPLGQSQRTETKSSQEFAALSKRAAGVCPRTPWTRGLLLDAATKGDGQGRASERLYADSDCSPSAVFARITFAGLFSR